MCLHLRIGIRYRITAEYLIPSKFKGKIERQLHIIFLRRWFIQLINLPPILRLVIFDVFSGLEPSPFLEVVGLAGEERRTHALDRKVVRMVITYLTK